MNFQELYKKVKVYIEKHPKQEYKIHKLSSVFHLKKKHYKILKKVLRNLQGEGLLVKRKRSYTTPPSNIKHIGTFDATALAKNYPFGYIETEHGDVKVYIENTLNAYHQDIVEFIVLKETKQGSVGKITRIMERMNSILIGSCFHVNTHIYFVSDNPKIDTEIEIIEPTDFNEIRDKKVVIEITDWGNRAQDILPQGKLKETLGSLEDPNVDFLSIIKEYGLPKDFSEEVMKEVETFPDSVSKYEISRRKDFRELLTFTIDPKTAKDFDDAISLEKQENGTYKLYIHIADVSHYVKYPSVLFNDAYERGTSVYLLQNVIPMLPFKLSNQLCSLQPDVERLTLTVIINYDQDFNALGSSMYPSVIRSDQRLNYEQVDQLFETGDNPDIHPLIKENLLLMRPLAQHLTKERYARGSLDFDLPESEFVFDEQGAPVDILRTHQTESHLLIEEFMLAANEFVAKLIAQKCNAGIFRIHESPKSEKLTEFAHIARAYGHNMAMTHKNTHTAIKHFLNSLKDEDQHRVFDYLLLRSLMKAKYSYQNVGHFGLALDSYTHFTSPIRRFPDLIVHHLIKQSLFEWTTKRFSLDEIKSFSQHSSAMEIRAMNAERSLGQLKKNRFMRKNMDKVFEALIVNFNNQNVFVELITYPIEGYIPLETLGKDYFEFDQSRYYVIGKRSKQRFSLCQKIQVRVKRIIHNIEFELVRE
ncbi:MAG TPA: ribonuclease R [Candidatus Cloacimonetes bacterium]|nr:ribonuclease R [Candidatus Cloacimonadota bacterium]HEX37528.1 ribonuclease R [Candidatus Cloacimonadota bacterium]